MNTLAIDFGTFNTAGAVMLDGTPYTIQSAEGPSFSGKSFPSFVEFDADGNMMSVGEPAKRIWRDKPELVVWGIKRLIGVTYKTLKERGELSLFKYPIEEDDGGDVVIPIGGKQYTPRDIVTFIIRKVKADAENPHANRALLGAKFSRAILSHPAYFGANRIGQLVAAAKGKDGARLFDEVATIAEPTAAATAYGLGTDSEQKVMAFDLGAGTLDVSIVRLRPQGKVLTISEWATSGSENLGGIDIDRHLYEGLKSDPLFVERRLSIDRGEAGVMADIEQAKIDLSEMDITAIRGRRPYTLTREKLESTLTGLLERMRAPIRTALTEAKITAADLDHLILVGGPTRMQSVRNVVANELRSLGARSSVIAEAESPPDRINPMECVAQGAALMGDQGEDVLDATIPEGYGLVMQGAYGPLREPNRKVPFESEPAELSHPFADVLYKTSVRLASKRPSADSPGKFDYKDLGEYSLYLNPQISHDINVVLEVTTEKELVIRLTQSAAPTNKAVYRGAGVSGESPLLEGISEQRESRIPPEILQRMMQNRKSSRPVVGNGWNEQDRQGLLEFARKRLIPALRTAASANQNKSPGVAPFEEFIRRAAAGTGDPPAWEVANRISEVVHSLKNTAGYDELNDALESLTPSAND